MLLQPIGTHHYPKNGKVYQVSQATKDEKDRNWVELVGHADGYAKVTHPDWFALYETMMAECGVPEHYIDVKQFGPCYLVFAKTPDGKIAHIGSIQGHHGRIELNG